MSKLFSKIKWALFVAVCGAMIFCGGGCNDFSSRESVEAGRPVLGGVTPFTLDAPEYDWKRPSNKYALVSTLNLEGKKLKVTVTGKHAKEQPAGTADGLAFMMVDANGKKSKQYNVGWFGTSGKTVEVTCIPEDGSETNWDTGVTTWNECDFTNIVSLDFINYSYVVKLDEPNKWDCVEGTGVELTVTEVKYEVID